MWSHGGDARSDFFLYTRVNMKQSSSEQNFD